MILTEPILLLMSLYIALIYGLLYAFFFSFPGTFRCLPVFRLTRLTHMLLAVVFGEDYGWDDGRVGLTFLSVIIGLLLALFITPQLEKDYLHRCAERGGKGEPEDRLIGMMMAAPFVPICKSFVFVSFDYMAARLTPSLQLFSSSAGLVLHMLCLAAATGLALASQAFPSALAVRILLSSQSLTLHRSCFVYSGCHLLLRQRFPDRCIPRIRRICTRR